MLNCVIKPSVTMARSGAEEGEEMFMGKFLEAEKESPWNSLIKSAKPPMYKKGSDKHQFILDFNYWAKLAKLPHEMMSYMFLLNIDPEIRREIEAFEIGAKAMEIDKVQQLFLELISTSTERLGARASLSSRKQKDGESLSAYMTNLFYLAREMGISPRIQKDRVREVFLEGIRSTALQDKVFEDDLIYELTDPKDVLRRAQFLEDIVKHRRQYVRAVSAPDVLRPEPLMNIATTAPVHLTRQLTKCTNCNAEGHTYRNCPSPRKCFHCREVGHFARNCPQRTSITHHPQGNE